MANTAETKESVNSSSKAAAKKDEKKGVFWKGLKAEFHKIIWADKERVARETTVVVIVTAILAGIIALVDFAVKAGIEFMIG